MFVLSSIIHTLTGGSQMKVFVAGGTGAIGRPLTAEFLAKGHALVALTRSPEKAQALVEQGIESAIADVIADGQRVPAATVLWSAGVLASPAGRWINSATDKSGRIIVNSDLSVPDYPEIFAIGDTAHVVAHS